MTKFKLSWSKHFVYVMCLCKMYISWVSYTAYINVSTGLKYPVSLGFDQIPIDIAGIGDMKMSHQVIL